MKIENLKNEKQKKNYENKKEFAFIFGSVFLVGIIKKERASMQDDFKYIK